MDLMLKNRTAIITGGASNIGRQTVLSFAEEGANVALFDIDEQAAQRVAQEARTPEGNRVVPIKVDVTDIKQVEQAFQKALGEFGRVDILANVAGWGIDEYFLDEPLEKQQKTVAINLWGPIHMLRTVLPHMVENKYGRVVIVSSDAGRMGEFREAVYAAAKAGVVALCKALSREVGKHNITFNAVCPGLTIPESADAMSAESLWRGNLEYWTPERQEKAARLYPLRRLGRPIDIANMIVFLASERANFITGQTISVSGGYTMM